ncbi:MAG: hypothetical protein NZ583_06075 [Desulfobacterota bacterium]|nr:hypothetical protein [Thermodesulfobacteriota bacterium]MDW8002570.1 hypothetical protein [Deltaproteobacteria bacterium]
MTITDLRITAIIRTYVKHMKIRPKSQEKVTTPEVSEDRVVISEEAMKKVLFERIGAKVANKARRHESEK